MKTMYSCEKCGKVFSDYDECYEHESKHWNLERWSGYDVDLDSKTEYKEGTEEPNIIHMLLKRWNSNNSDYDTMFAKYRLVCTYKTETVIDGDEH